MDAPAIAIPSSTEKTDTAKSARERFEETTKNHSPKPLHIILKVLAGVTLYLLLCHELMRHLPSVASLAIMGVLPITLWPLWRIKAKKYGISPFLFLKTYSVTSGSCLFLLGSLSTEISTSMIGIIIYAFMVVNILEAIVFESILRKKDGIGKLNIIAGIFIMISTPLWSGAYVTIDASTNDFLYSSPAIWIIAYTIWNASFVYNLFKGQVFGLQFAVLLAPLILFMVMGPDIWFQARFFTLAMFLTAYNCFYAYFYLNFGTAKYYSEKFNKILQTSSLIAASACLVNFLIYM